MTEISRFSNGSLRLNETRINRVVPTDTTTYSIQHATSTFEGPVEPRYPFHPTAIRVERYAAEQHHLRFTFPNGTTTVISFDRNSDGRTPTLELVVAAFDTQVAGRTPCGPHSCYRVRSTELGDPDHLERAVLLPEEWTVTDGTLFALIDERGLVREYRVRYTVATPNETYTAVRQVRYTALGETVVVKPGWVDE
jgi:hypothetical protein